MMRFRGLIAAAIGGISATVILSPLAMAQVAPGIPEPDNRNVIVQLFNWRFNDIKNVLPTLRDLGYSHVHVSPAQKSNEYVWQWWGRYQPVDYSIIEGPLGSEVEYQQMMRSLQVTTCRSSPMSSSTIRLMSRSSRIRHSSS